MRTLSAQGDSVDSAAAAIPADLLVPPTPHPRTAPKSKPLASAGAPETKEEHLGPHVKRDESWEQTRSVSPVHGHMLEPPSFHGPLQGRRSPSPNRILPQPQGTPVPNTVAKAMAREAAQRVAESNRVNKGNLPPEALWGWLGHCHSCQQRLSMVCLEEQAITPKLWACRASGAACWNSRLIKPSCVCCRGSTGNFTYLPFSCCIFTRVCSCSSLQPLLELPAVSLPQTPLVWAPR